MDIKVLHITSENRGDHTADIYKLYSLLPDETVVGLVERLKLNDLADSIEIKLVG